MERGTKATLRGLSHGWQRIATVWVKAIDVLLSHTAVIVATYRAPSWVADAKTDAGSPRRDAEAGAEAGGDAGAPRREAKAEADAGAPSRQT